MGFVDSNKNSVRCFEEMGHSLKNLPIHNQLCLWRTKMRRETKCCLIPTGRGCSSLQHQFVPRYLVQRYTMSWIRGNIKQFVVFLHPVCSSCIFSHSFVYGQEVRTVCAGLLYHLAPFLCKSRSLSNHTSNLDINGETSTASTSRYTPET